MATTFINMSRVTEAGQNNARFLRMARDARDGLRNQLALMFTMIDGDGSSIAHFDQMVTEVGYGGWVANNAVTDAQRTQAKASWDELNSLSAKLSAVTGDVTGTAITQGCAKHGV
jgi:hypothetical protein